MLKLGWLRGWCRIGLGLHCIERRVLWPSPFGSALRCGSSGRGFCPGGLGLGSWLRGCGEGGREVRRRCWIAW